MYDFRVSLRMAALGLLAQQPGSGYDLLRVFEKSMANVWPATQSQLYGELNKLADGGLIEVTDIGPRGRKEYRITSDGRDELQRWLLSPEVDPPFRDASLLRIFLLGEIAPKQARLHMVAVAAQADSELQRYKALEESIDWTDGDDMFFSHTALEYGIRRAAMQGDWARWVIAELDKRAKFADKKA